MEKKENNYMTSGPNKFELWAAIVVFVLFVVPTICSGAYAVFMLARWAVTGKEPGEKEPKSAKEVSEEIDKIVDDFWRARETDAELHFREPPERPRILDPSDPEFFASYNRRGKEAK